MKWIKYVGAHDFVDVPRWQIGAAERGKPIEVIDEAAEDLLTQEANWVATRAPRNVLRADSDPLANEPGAGSDDDEPAAPAGQEG